MQLLWAPKTKGRSLGMHILVSGPGPIADWLVTEFSDGHHKSGISFFNASIISSYLAPHAARTDVATHGNAPKSNPHHTKTPTPPHGNAYGSDV